MLTHKCSECGLKHRQKHIYKGKIICMRCLLKHQHKLPVVSPKIGEYKCKKCRKKFFGYAFQRRKTKRAYCSNKCRLTDSCGRFKISYDDAINKTYFIRKIGKGNSGGTTSFPSALIGKHFKITIVGKKYGSSNILTPKSADCNAILPIWYDPEIRDITLKKKYNQQTVKE